MHHRRGPGTKTAPGHPASWIRVRRASRAWRHHQTRNLGHRHQAMRRLPEAGCAAEQPSVIQRPPVTADAR
jgi:hypothetical protein